METIINSKEIIKKSAEEAASDALSSIVYIFLLPAVFLWMTPTFIYLMPALAPLAALGYWKWFGLLWCFGYICNKLGKIFHR